MKNLEAGARSVPLDEDARTFSRYDLGNAQTGCVVNLITNYGEHALTKIADTGALEGWQLDENDREVLLTISNGVNVLHRVVLDTGQEILVSDKEERVLRSLGKVSEIAIEMGDYARN